MMIDIVKSNSFLPGNFTWECKNVLNEKIFRFSINRSLEYVLKTAS